MYNIACNHTSFQFQSKLMLSSQNTSFCTSTVREKSKLSVFSTKNQSLKASFLGESLRIQNERIGFSELRKDYVRFEPIRALVKRRKEAPFDNVVQRDKKLRLVLKIRKILVGQPNRVMSLRELGKYRKELGLTQKRRFIALLRKYPAVFEIVEEGVFSLQFKMTDEAEKLYLDELRYKNEMEDMLVVKLRKLLMMSLDKRILLEKIAHLRTDLGLPLEFRDTICQRYLQYFKVVVTGRGPALELTHWDHELAVSAAELVEEENRARERDEENLIIDRPAKFKRAKLPKGLNLSKGEMKRVSMFREMPYISPYFDFTDLRAGTAEKEKHACAVVHEMLSLTLEKRTLVDHFTHFREEFRFSQQLRGMLIRHPDMFYVSLKGDRDSVFLREAYRDSQLIEKDKMMLFKEKLRALVSVPRFSNRGARRRDMGGEEGDDMGEEENDEEDRELDAMDKLMGDEVDEEDEDYEDDWSDEDDDDDTPPDFDEEGEIVKFEAIKREKIVNNEAKNEEKILEPVFPDGRPRECW